MKTIFIKYKKQVIGFLVGLSLINIFAWAAVYNLSQPQFLEVIFFDVGQGDATLVKTPKNNLILIDGGPDSTILEKLAQETNFWQKEIDLIVLSHFHKDHFFGLKKVIQKYNVEKILWNGAVEQTPAFEQWLEIIEQSGAEIIIAKAGQRIKENDLSIDVLYPLINAEHLEVKDANLFSVILRLTFKNNSFLFMGDAYQSIEKELINQQDVCQEKSDYFCQVMILKSHVLKVGHHGSKTSTSPEFIEQVSPAIAVISAGKNNKHNHPHPETLAVLEKYDITVLRTDLNGDIKIFSNGEDFKIIKN